MNLKTLLISFSFAGLMSCSSAYKVTQTPDDVYYSPARNIDSYEENDKKDEYKENHDRYDDRNYGYEQWDDRRLRLRCQSRYNRWKTFDDYSWNYNWYSTGYSWRYDYWTDTWYPVSDCSCNSWYTYNSLPHWFHYYKPVYASAPRPKNNTRWTNTNYNSGNYNNNNYTPPKGSIKNNQGYSLDKPRYKTSDGSSKRSFNIPSSSSSGSSSGGSSSGGKSGGRAFRN